MACFSTLIDREQAKIIDYLKSENQFLKKQLGNKRVRLTDDERRLLAVKGKALGRKTLSQIACIVTPDTILRWHRKLIAMKWDYSDQRKKAGRPRVTEEIEKLTLLMAKNNPSWGYERIRGALKNLGHAVSASAIRRVLRNHGIEPSPKRPMRWKEFLNAHWESLAAIDFCNVEVWTLRGLKTFYVLAAIDLATRKVKIVSVTKSPNGVWMHGVAREWVSESNCLLADKKFLIHDRAPSFCRLFAQPLENAGVEMFRLPPRSPNMNAYCERFIRSLKEELIDRMIFFGEASLRKALDEYAEHYHRERNHQGIDNELIDPREKLSIRAGPVQCRERLGGMLKYYHRNAA